MNNKHTFSGDLFDLGVAMSKMYAQQKSWDQKLKEMEERKSLDQIYAAQEAEAHQLSEADIDDMEARQIKRINYHD